MGLLIIASVSMGAALAAGWVGGGELFLAGLDRAERDLGQKLRRLRVSTARVRRVIIAWLIFAFCVFFTMAAVLNMPLIGMTIGIILISLPWYAVRRMAEKRMMLIEDQLADAMVSLSSAIKAGLSLAQAMDILAQQTPRPICQEFQQISAEYQLGKPLEQCLTETKERLRSENFALFAAAIEASRQSGGRLNETVDRIAHSVRELQRLERKVLSETAQARASAFYMALAPVAVLALYYFFVDPANTERLFTTVWGQILLSVTVVLNVVAYLWARSILNPDI